MTMPKIAPAAGRAALLGLLFLSFLPRGVSAQASGRAFDDAARGETVSWTVALPPPGIVKPGARVALTLQGTVLDGWHVYGLRQVPAGPTPLKISLDESAVAAAAGKISASAPVRVHDRGFDLDVEYYSRAFTVTVPLRIAAKAADGPQQIPVSVRFQTCNDRICQPPKTVRLAAPVTVRTGG